MEPRFCNPKDLISTTGFSTTFKLGCNSNKIHLGPAMWFLPYYVQKSLAKMLSIGMCAERPLVPLAASVQYKQHWSGRFLRSKSEGVYYLLNKYASSKAFAEYDTSILWYMQLANMTSQQYANGITAMA